MAADISGVLGPGHGTAAGGVGTCCCCLRARMQERKGWAPQGGESELFLVVLAARWAAGSCKGPALERTDRRAIRAGRPMTAERLGRVHRCVRMFLPRARVPLDWRPPGSWGGLSDCAGRLESVSQFSARGREGARSPARSRVGLSLGLRPRKRSGGLEHVKFIMHWLEP